MENIAKLICQKSKISYLVFNEDLKLLDFSSTMHNIVDNPSMLQYDTDIREIMWDFVGMEERLSLLYHDEAQTIHFPMVMKGEDYYDLDIEVFEDSVDAYFIAYLTLKTRESLTYIHTIKEINKKILVYQREKKKEKEEHYNLINERVINFNVDMDGIITVINDAFAYFFDLPNDKIISEHFSKFFKTREENFNNSNTIILNATNTNNEIVSFHANIIPVTQNDITHENIIICQDITYLKQIEKELEFAAGHDSLTGLPNRSQLLKKMDEVILKCDKENLHFTICFIDLDKFKPVNDNYGHHAGDMLLKHIAKVLSNFVRKGDVVARIGGDEFVILFDSLTDDNYINTMQKRLSNLPKKHPLIYSQDDTIDFGFSLGLATYPQDAIEAQELLKIADKAMYHSKRGRSRS